MEPIIPHNGEESQGAVNPQWAATLGIPGGTLPDMGNNLRRLRDGKGWTHDQAAAAMGISRGGFIKLERGERRLTSDYISRAAEAFDVPASAVISDNASVPVMGKIGAGAIIEPEYEQVSDDGLDVIELPFPVPDEMVAFRVEGDSMMPRYDDGDIVLVWRNQRRSTESFVGDEAAVRTADGRRYLKRILRGAASGTYTLDSFNAKPIESARVRWIGEIYAIIRAGQVKRVQVREQAAPTNKRPRKRLNAKM